MPGLEVGSNADLLREWLQGASHGMDGSMNPLDAPNHQQAHMADVAAVGDDELAAAISLSLAGCGAASGPDAEQSMVAPLAAAQAIAQHTTTAHPSALHMEHRQLAAQPLAGQF